MDKGCVHTILATERREVIEYNTKKLKRRHGPFFYAYVCAWLLYEKDACFVFCVVSSVLPPSPNKEKSVRSSENEKGREAGRGNTLRVNGARHLWHAGHAELGHAHLGHGGSLSHFSSLRLYRDEKNEDAKEKERTEI